MTCKEWIKFEEGDKTPQQQAQWQTHAKTCAYCREQQALSQAIGQALVPAAAPAHLVDAVLAKTTRKQPLWIRWRKVLVGSMAALFIAAGVYGISQRTTPFNRAELVTYMSESNQDDYYVFTSDLDLFEQEF